MAIWSLGNVLTGRPDCRPMSPVSVQGTLSEPARAAVRRTLDTELFLRILDILIDIGCAISEAVLQKAQAGTAPLSDASAVYQRISSTVRRMIMLALQISAPDEGETAQPPAARKRVGGKGKDGGERGERKDKPERDPADEPDAPYDIKNQMMDAVIGEICRDLGLPMLDGTHPWAELTPKQIAKLVVDAVAVLLAEAAAERAAPSIPDGVYWGTRSWLRAKARARARSGPRVRDG